MQKISTLWPHLAPFWPRLAPFGQYGPCAHVFASCARVRARIFTKIFVWVFYYHISLSFKFHTDPSFCCGDIFSDTRYFKVPIRQGGILGMACDVVATFDFSWCSFKTVIELCPNTCLLQNFGIFEESKPDFEWNRAKSMCGHYDKRCKWKTS